MGTVKEHSIVGDSSTNGETERAIQEVGGLVRTLKFALEERTGGQKIDVIIRDAMARQARRGPDH